MTTEQAAVARRYAGQSVLGIAAEEDTDGPADPEADIPF